MIVVYAIEALFVAAFYLSLAAVAASPVYWVVMIRSQQSRDQRHRAFKVPARR